MNPVRMNCPNCGSKQWFSCTESTKMKRVWKECFACGYQSVRKVIDDKEIQARIKAGGKNEN